MMANLYFYYGGLMTDIMERDRKTKKNLFMEESK